MANIKTEIFKTIKYFNYFSYLPSFDEIYIFLQYKVSKEKLTDTIDLLNKQKKLTKWSDLSGSSKPHLNNTLRYTLGEYSIKQYKNYRKRVDITRKKLNDIKMYFKFLSFLSWIKFVGLSGSAAMANCNQSDDVDICIITSHNRLFLARFWAIFLALIFSLKKSRQGICLNLFFDEMDLAVPKYKQTGYIAHESLQMKPIINKSYTYEKFLKANKWVFRLFPNADKNKLNIKRQELRKKHLLTTYYLLLATYIGNIIELFLKKWQLEIIKRNKTGLLVSPTQLWLFRRDFEKKIRT